MTTRIRLDTGGMRKGDRLGAIKRARAWQGGLELDDVDWLIAEVERLRRLVAELPGIRAVTL